MSDFGRGAFQAAAAIAGDAIAENDLLKAENERLRDLVNKGFMLCEIGPGHLPRVVIKFEEMKDAQALHKALSTLAQDW